MFLISFELRVLSLMKVSVASICLKCPTIPYILLRNETHFPVGELVVNCIVFLFHNSVCEVSRISKLHLSFNEHFHTFLSRQFIGLEYECTLPSNNDDRGLGFPILVII